MLLAPLTIFPSLVPCSFQFYTLCSFLTIFLAPFTFSEPTCAHAWWTVRGSFLSICPSVCLSLDQFTRKIQISSCGLGSRSKVTWIRVKGHIGQGQISIMKKGGWAHNKVELLHCPFFDSGWGGLGRWKWFYLVTFVDCIPLHPQIVVNILLPSISSIPEYFLNFPFLSNYWSENTLKRMWFNLILPWYWAPPVGSGPF